MLTERALPGVSLRTASYHLLPAGQRTNPAADPGCSESPSILLTTRPRFASPLNDLERLRTSDSCDDTNFSFPSFWSIFREGRVARAGADGDEEEDSGNEDLGGSVSVGGDVSLPAGSVGPGLLAVCQTLQSQLGQEETVSRTGEVTWRHLLLEAIKEDALSLCFIEQVVITSDGRAFFLNKVK